MPCDWTLDPTTCDPNWAGYPQATKDFAIACASAVVWASTGRQFGECEVIVRPCGKWDGNAWWGGWMWGFYATGWSWGGYVWEGSLANICSCSWAGNGWCNCAPSNQIWLPGPVSEIVSVNQNGSIVDPTTYRVDDWQWLVRTSVSGGVVNEWPWQQNYNFDSGDANTLTVTYKRGRPVPSPLLYAASLLASQYAKACAGGDCQLPGRVASVVRQNVSIHLVPLEDLMRYGLTGYAIVDQMIRAFNPYGLQWATTIISPDQPTTRQTTWSGP